MSRYDILHRIEQFDPIKDHVEIYRLLVCYEFPWDYIRSLEVALYRSYCVPSISALLDKTGELVYRTQKRYDDTAILISEWSANGYDSERGRAALRRMNRIHKHFNITNEDFLVELLLLGVTQSTLGFFAILGLIIVNASRHTVNWAQPGTWVWIGLFAVLMLTGIVMIVLALGKRPVWQQGQKR